MHAYSAILDNLEHWRDTRLRDMTQTSQKLEPVWSSDGNPEPRQGLLHQQTQWWESAIWQDSTYHPTSKHWTKHCLFPSRSNANICKMTKNYHLFHTCELCRTAGAPGKFWASLGRGGACRWSSTCLSQTGSRTSLVCKKPSFSAGFTLEAFPTINIITW